MVVDRLMFIISVVALGSGIPRDEGYDTVALLCGLRGWNGYQQGSLTYRLRSLFWRLR